MREIKFRAWSKSENLMGEVTGFRFSKSQYPFVNARFRKNGKTVDEGYHFGQEDGCDSVILMQFTGLYDKNGVEIYEGDIVIPQTFTNAKYRVYWSQERLQWSIINTSNVSKESGRALINNSTLYEVIGNIYENPELLKGNG